MARKVLGVIVGYVVMFILQVAERAGLGAVHISNSGNRRRTDRRTIEAAFVRSEARASARAARGV
jgi:hypothetical protein